MKKWITDYKPLTRNPNKESVMTNLDYALMMLEIYEADDPLNFDAIVHYKELANRERERIQNDD